MGGHFEVRDADLAGRIGQLEIPRADRTLETPALLPVVNPNLLTIEPARMAAEFGVEALITNAYIVHGDDDLRERALSDGLGELLEFEGAVFTDSGSFQLAEYGEIDVTTEEILAFQRDAGADVGTPVDVPTPPDVDRERASDELATTQDRLETAAAMDTGEMLVTAPIQGSTHADLRERAAADAAATDLDVFPVGAVVPLLTEYRYGDLVDVVAAAKRGLGPAGPVHLFGAGHPMTFALSVALGCDLFDSAAYAIYARDDRYMTVRGTSDLADLDYLPCACAVCADATPAGLRELPDSERATALAAHNLHVSLAEIDRIKQAIRRGTLAELLESRARAHPALLDGYRTLLTHADQLERTDPVSKDNFFYLSTESARRPAVARYHDRLERIAPSGSVLVSPEGRRDDDYDECWVLVAPFGPVPPALRTTYPLTATVPDRLDDAARAAAARGVARLAASAGAVTLEHENWSDRALAPLPPSVTVVDREA